MSAPVVGWYEKDDATVINAANKLAFGNITAGATATPSAVGQSPLHLWNDKGGGAAATMTAVQVGFKNSSGGDTGEYIAGTTLNGNVPFFQAKSYGSTGCADDAQSGYTAVGGTTWLSVGNIPANACRWLYLQFGVPADASNGLNLAGRPIVSYWYEA